MNAKGLTVHILLIRSVDLRSDCTARLCYGHNDTAWNSGRWTIDEYRVQYYYDLDKVEMR